MSRDTLDGEMPAFCLRYRNTSSISQDRGIHRATRCRSRERSLSHVAYSLNNRDRQRAKGEPEIREYLVQGHTAGQSQS